MIQIFFFPEILRAANIKKAVHVLRELTDRILQVSDDIVTGWFPRRLFRFAKERLRSVISLRVKR